MLEPNLVAMTTLFLKGASLAEQLLGELPINLGRIEKGHALFDGGMDQGDAVLFRGMARNQNSSPCSQGRGWRLRGRCGRAFFFS